MNTYPITKHPEKILAKKLESVSDSFSDISEIIESMRNAMRAAKGVGLAANQIGLDMCLFIIDKELAKKHGIPDAFINPEITEYSQDETPMEEGCLSLPEQWFMIQRSSKVKIQFTDEKGKRHKLRARGFLARVLQHEYDHLQGILIKDRKAQQSSKKHSK